MSKLKSMVQGIYSRKQARKQKKGLNQQELVNGNSEDYKEYIEPSQQPNGTLKMTDNLDIDNKQSQRDDRSFLSINDFLNADEFANTPNPLF